MKNDGNARSHSSFVGAGFKPALASREDASPADSPPPQRIPLRLPRYDYASPGAYFVTLCTHKRRCLFGAVDGDAMRLNAAGNIIESCWHSLPRHYEDIMLDAFVVMPNHVHGIIVIEAQARHGLTEIVRGFKTYSARGINAASNTPGRSLWQRGYHEHVIRSETVLARIREYILINPVRWALDRENPANIEAARTGRV